MKFVTPEEAVYQRSVIAAAQAQARARAQAQAQGRAQSRPVQRVRSIAAAPQSNNVTPVINFVVINSKK